MSILSDRDILDCMKKGELTIENFNEKNLTPNGYDITVEEIFYQDEVVRDGTVEIKPLKWFAVSTKEYFKIGEELAGQIWLRTSWSRKGILASFGKIDAGFEGTLTLSGFNASDKTVRLSIGDRFAQTVFERLGSKALKPYGKRSAHYSEQRGITLEPPNRTRSEP